MKKNKVLSTFIRLRNIYEKLGDKYRTLAYNNAIELIKNNETEDLTKHLKEKIKYIETHDTFPELVLLEKYLPLLDVMGIGPKFVRGLIDKDIVIDKPEDLIGKVKLNDLQILGIKNYKRILHNIPRKCIETIAKEIRSGIVCNRFDVVGSYRRGKKTSGDIDILISDMSENNIPKMKKCFAVISNGKKRFTFLWKHDKWLVHVDIRFIEVIDYPSALMYFTGSGDFNMMIRSIAKNKGYLLNEYGLFEGDTRLKLDSEEEIFNKLGFKYIPPEKRYVDVWDK